jgi:DNA-directed RNA polymerase subunit RPC12/RpoP
MSYKCLECGNIFEYGEDQTWVESHGEKLRGCPICGGAYKKTVKCSICGGEFLKGELHGGCVCNECIDEYRKDFDTCYNLSKNEKEKVEINILLISLIGEDNIEKILYHYLKCQNNVDCSGFIDEDKDWFAERLAEEVKK